MTNDIITTEEELDPITVIAGTAAVIEGVRYCLEFKKHYALLQNKTKDIVLDIAHKGIGIAVEILMSILIDIGMVCRETFKEAIINIANKYGGYMKSNGEIGVYDEPQGIDDIIVIQWDKNGKFECPFEVFLRFANIKKKEFKQHVWGRVDMYMKICPACKKDSYSSNRISKHGRWICPYCGKDISDTMATVPKARGKG